MGQRYNKNAKTGDCGFQKVALEVSEVKLRKKKQAANCIPFSWQTPQGVFYLRLGFLATRKRVFKIQC
mgnify:CR=1 FL=1